MSGLTFSIYQAFADPLRTAMMRAEFDRRHRLGVKPKQLRFELINTELEEKRERL